ncbi:putative Oxidoreductase FAD-binding protein [Seiridium cardinale]
MMFLRFSYSLIASALVMAAAAAADFHPSAVTSDLAKSTLSKSGTICKALSVFLGDNVSYSCSTAYNSSIASYWSEQEAEIFPSCVVTPTSKEDVSLAIFILNIGSKIFPGQSNFAIRSGGHTPFAGAANINSGITIDLKNLNKIDVSADKSVVEIGPGNRWGDVYSVLDEQGLAIPGGRVSIVGVGGLVTGGGISFFSPRYGFVCDNIENFEVVLATGQIVNANSKTNPDLWKALKGGSNNFGVVTSFTVRAFAQGKLWGGFIGLDISTLTKQFQAFEDLTGSANYDPYAALIFNLVWDVSSDTWSTAHSLEYTKPQANPPVFQNFTSLPQLFSTMRISNLTDFTVELAASNPAGRRQLFVTKTYKNSAAMMASIYQISQTVVKPLTAISAIKWSLSFQPVPTVLLSKAASTGGNSLGLDASDGNLFNVLLTASWDDAADDALISTQAKALFDQAEVEAKDLDVAHPYLYLNYAAPWQDPMSGYGAESKANLQTVSKKYDPAGVFQKNVPGGFKLFT